MSDAATIAEIQQDDGRIYRVESRHWEREEFPCWVIVRNSGMVRVSKFPLRFDIKDMAEAVAQALNNAHQRGIDDNRKALRDALGLFE